MLNDKIKSLLELLEIRQDLKNQLKTVVFTNGVFDILHRGHVEYLTHARKLGDTLFLGLNSDISVRKVKGPGKPLVGEEDRAIVLAGLSAVDYICLFDEDTNLLENVINTVKRCFANRHGKHGYPSMY